MMRCYIFDLDGTLANIDHRLHHILDPNDKTRGVSTDAAAEPHKPDWDAFYAACVGDKPIPELCHLAHALMLREWVCFCSGRSEVVREQTLRWLGQYVAPPGHIAGRSKLYMRKDGDHRQDHVVKGEMLHWMRADGFEPIMAFEDRDQVVKMWREAGLVCAQVAPGAF